MGVRSINNMTSEQRALLELLVNGIIPADARDQGAASVNAAERLAQKVEATGTYLEGLNLAAQLARERFHRETGLTPEQVDELLGLVRERTPGFFKQLRIDVSALYLSDPQVWARIGFPGPSTDKGGYPDFDQRQAKPGK